MNPRRRPGVVAGGLPTALLPIALFFVFAGCAPLVLGAAAGATNPLGPILPPKGRYVSATPFDTTGINVRSLRLRPEVVEDSIEVSLATPQVGEANHSRALRRAFVAPPAAPPCTAGWMAESMWLANQQRWDRPLPLADELDLAFPLPRAYLREPLVLDLIIEDATGSHCNRVPLGSSDEHSLALETRTSGGGGFGWIRGRPVRTDGMTGPSLDVYGFVLMSSLGRWFGLWRLGGRLEACFLSCAAGNFITAPTLATVERLLYRGRLVTAAASVGYQVGRIEDAVHALQGHGTWAHGPRVGVLVLGPRPFAGADPGEAFAARGFEVFVQRQFFSAGTALLEPPPWILGLTVVAL